jgi:hypothetical protein
MSLCLTCSEEHFDRGLAILHLTQLSLQFSVALHYTFRARNLNVEMSEHLFRIVMVVRVSRSFQNSTYFSDECLQQLLQSPIILVKGVRAGAPCSL